MSTDPISPGAGATRTEGLDAPDDGGQGGQAREKAQEVGGQARQQSQQVTGTAKEQAGRVGQEAREQAHDLFGQASQQFRGQAQDQTQRLGGTLQSLATDMRALAEGHPDDAGAVGDYAQQAVERVQGFADRVEERGFDGLLDDVQQFARRRPGAFLLSAAVAGFAVGRLARGARDANADDTDELPPRPLETLPPRPSERLGTGAEFDRPSAAGTPGTAGGEVTRPAAPSVGPTGTGMATGAGMATGTRPVPDPLTTRTPIEDR